MSDICVLNIIVAKVWGGGEQYVYDTAKAMAKQGTKVFIALDKNNDVMKKRFSEVAEVVSFNLNVAFGVFALKSLIKFIKNRHINIINCHSGHAMQFCMLLKLFTGAKLVMFKHNALLAKHDFYHIWQRKYTDAFVCVSKLVYDLQTKGLSDKENRKFYLIYNGIDTEKFDKYNKIEKDTNKFIIGYAGRITYNKGIDMLMKAFLHLSYRYDNIYLHIAGGDEGYLKEVQKFIIKNKLEKKVKYFGNIKDMEYFYKNLDLFILPSVVKEAFGLVLCEAMYCGVPVITTDSGAQKEIIDNNINGIIIQKKNLEILISKISDLYNNRNLCVRFGVLGNKKVKEKFTINICVKSILNLYKRLINYEK